MTTPNPYLQSATQNQNMQNVLAQIFASRKAQGASQMPSPQMQPMQDPGAPQIPQASRSPQTAINNVSALSQMSGAPPNTMFGVNLGGSGPNSLPNNSDIMGMLGMTGGAAGGAGGASGILSSGILGSIMSLFM